jgi:hypothetical protein
MGESEPDLRCPHQPPMKAAAKRVVQRGADTGSRNRFSAGAREALA